MHYAHAKWSHTGRLVPALNRALGRQRLHLVILGDSVAVGEKDYDTFRAGQRLVRYGFGGITGRPCQ